MSAPVATRSFSREQDALPALWLRSLTRLRLQDWWYMLGIPLLGFFHQLPRYEEGTLGAVLGAAALYLAHGYSFNSYFDTRLERRRPSATELSPGSPADLLLSLALLLLAILLAFLWVTPLAALVLTAGGAVSVLYSSPWTRLKRYPLVNLLLNSTGFSLLFLVGHLANKPMTVSALLCAGYLWLGIIPLQIVHMLSHQQEERAWRWGFPSTMRLILLVQVLWCIHPLLLWPCLRGLERLALSALTLLYCLSVDGILLQLIRRHGSSTSTIARARQHLRLASLLFGGLLLLGALP